MKSLALPFQLRTGIRLLPMAIELADQFRVAVVDRFRYDDRDFSVKVTRATVGSLDPLAFGAEPGTAGSSAGDFQGNRAVRRRNVDFRAKCGFGNCHGHA